MNLFAFKKYKIKGLINKELKKNLIKYFLSNQYKNFKSNKIMKFIYRNKFYYKYYSVSFLRRSGIVSGNCRSVFRLFKLSRYFFKYYEYNEIISGLSKIFF